MPWPITPAPEPRWYIWNGDCDVLGPFPSESEASLGVTLLPQLRAEQLGLGVGQTFWFHRHRTTCECGPCLHGKR
jgi:hypothetical protein